MKPQTIQECIGYLSADVESIAAALETISSNQELQWAALERIAAALERIAPEATEGGNQNGKGN